MRVAKWMHSLVENAIQQLLDNSDDEFSDIISETSSGEAVVHYYESVSILEYCN